MTKTETVLVKLHALLETVPGPKVERNSVVPTRIPAEGLIILRDGDPGEAEEVLGGFANTFYEHVAEIETYVQAADDTTRDTASATLHSGIGTVLESDRTLGGEVQGMLYGQPQIETLRVEGGPAMKNGRIEVLLNYESATPLG